MFALVAFAESLNCSFPASSLPSPQSSLKYYTLGIGTQNYTCESTPNNNSVAPVSVGALAKLYNLKPFCNAPSGITFDPCKVLELEERGSLHFNDLPLSFGTHYFDNSTPHFKIGGLNYAAQKVAGVPAPTTGNACNSSAGAVDWLKLEVLNASGSVFRVDTAGGKAPPTCASQSGQFQVEYAAHYLFYQK
jgi:hypothetical protein